MITHIFLGLVRVCMFGVGCAFYLRAIQHKSTADCYWYLHLGNSHLSTHASRIYKLIPLRPEQMANYLALKALNSGDAMGGALVETSLVTKNRLCDKGQAPWLLRCHMQYVAFPTCL